jgi:hypothetical protein
MGVEVEAEGVKRRTSGGAFRARLGGRGDAGGKAGSLFRAAAASGILKAGEAGAGETEVDVVGVVAVSSVAVANMLIVVETGEAGPESTSAGGMSLGGVVLSEGDSGSGIRCGEGGIDVSSSLEA